MRVCVIGSSHVGALRSGWDLVRNAYPDVEMTFFASLGISLRLLRVSEGKLVPADDTVAQSIAYTSGGHREIDPGEFDIFLVYGLVLLVPRVELGISAAVRREVVQGSVTRGITQETVDKLRKVTDKPILIAPCPLQTTLDGTVEDRRFVPYGSLIAEMAAALDLPGDHLLRQPEETIGPDLHTPKVFGRGAQSLLPRNGGGEHILLKDKDLRHMNAEFGRLWLQANLPLIRAQAVA